MAVEYDLIVLGATAAARAAAITAAQCHARVAWVCDTVPAVEPLLRLREGVRCWAALGQSVTQQAWGCGMHLLQTAMDAKDLPSTVQPYGVDYLEGFGLKAGLAVQADGIRVAQRWLRSRSYLLAMEPVPALPLLPGMDHPRVWSVARLEQELRLMDRVWPQSFAVWGHDPQAVELCHSLRRLGRSVRLLTGGSPLLPQEDAELAFLVQSYLEGDGILVDNQGALTQIQPAPTGGLSLTVGDRQYASSVLVYTDCCTPWQLPPLLSSLGLQQHSVGLTVTPDLQTTQPHFYACGSLLGGYRLPSLARQEAKRAVQNALFEQRSPMVYAHLPYGIHSHPPLARVGLTETQARRYDPHVQVLRQTYKGCDRALFEQAPPGLCKVLVQKNGTLLGVHLLGAAAEELIVVFALAIQQGIRLQELSRVGAVSASFAEVVPSLAEQWWHRQHQRDRHERWFFNRRRQMPDVL